MSCFVCSFFALLLVKMFVRHAHGSHIRRIRKGGREIRLVLWAIRQEQRSPGLKRGPSAWNNSFCGSVKWQEEHSRSSWVWALLRLTETPGVISSRDTMLLVQFGPQNAEGEVSMWLEYHFQAPVAGSQPRSILLPWQRGDHTSCDIQWWQQAKGPSKTKLQKLFNVACKSAETPVLTLFEIENKLQMDLWELLRRKCLWNLRKFLSPSLVVISC